MEKRSSDDELPAGTPADVVEEYGPFSPGEHVHGVSYDGERVWFATGARLRALDPKRKALTGELQVPCDAGTAFDGTYLYQLANRRIQKVELHSGRVLETLPWTGDGDDAGLTWAEGKLWIAKYRARKILQIDPKTGAVLRTLESSRFVTGVTWLNGDLWHGTLENDASELRHVDEKTGKVLARLEMPAGTLISGLESNGADLFYCGGARSGKIRAVRRPARK